MSSKRPKRLKSSLVWGSPVTNPMHPVPTGQLARRAPDQSTEKKHPWWEHPVKFAGHVFFGTLIFIIIAGGAVLLNRFVLYLEEMKPSPPIYMTYFLKAVEFIVFTLDIVVFIYYIIRRAWEFAKEI